MFVAHGANHLSWSGTDGDYTDSAMWYNGIVAETKDDCVELSCTAAGAATAYIREGMCITNGCFSVGERGSGMLLCGDL